MTMSSREMTTRCWLAMLVIASLMKWNDQSPNGLAKEGKRGEVVFSRGRRQSAPISVCKFNAIGVLQHPDPDPMICSQNMGSTYSLNPSYLPRT